MYAKLLTSSRTEHADRMFLWTATLNVALVVRTTIADQDDHGHKVLTSVCEELGIFSQNDLLGINVSLARFLWLVPSS
jgi:hypothetical protein